MDKKRNGGTSSRRLRTIKVYDDTYTELVKISSVFQLEMGEKVSFDFVIRKLIDNTPQTIVKIDAPKSNGSSTTTNVQSKR